MSVVPRTVFLNRTYISHEHQQQLCVHNVQRREDSLNTTFLLRDNPSLSPADIIHKTLVNLHRLYEAEGYQVHTVSDTDGFTVALDWRETVSHTPSHGNVIPVRLLFYVGVIEWLIALAASSVGLTGPAVIAGGIAVVMMFLYFYFYTEENDEMFGKRPEPTITQPATPELPTEERVAQKNVPVADAEIAGHTVIAKGVLFTGNIRAPGLIQVWGELQGNVDVLEDTISVMHGGMVEGDVTCRRLMVNGRVSGNCRAGHVEIGKHGVISGTLLYSTLSIHTGGQICGESGLLGPEATPAPAFEELLGQESEVSPLAFSDLSLTGEDGADEDDDNRHP